MALAVVSILGQATVEREGPSRPSFECPEGQTTRSAPASANRRFISLSGGASHMVTLKAEMSRPRAAVSYTHLTLPTILLV